MQTNQETENTNVNESTRFPNFIDNFLNLGPRQNMIPNPFAPPSPFSPSNGGRQSTSVISNLFRIPEPNSNRNE